MQENKHNISRTFTSTLAGRFYRDGSGLAIKRLAIRKEKQKEKKEEKAIRLMRKVEASKQRFEEMKKNDELRRVRENRRKKKRIAKMRKLNIAASTIQVYARTWLRVRRLESRRKEEEKLRRKSSARIIQNSWRQFSLQREHDAYVKRIRKEQEAGLLIMQFVRLNLSRKRERDAIRKIENAWYQHDLRRKRRIQEEIEREMKRQHQILMIENMQASERNGMCGEDKNALYLDDERDTKSMLEFVRAVFERDNLNHTTLQVLVWRNPKRWVWNAERSSIVNVMNVS